MYSLELYDISGWNAVDCDLSGLSIKKTRQQQYIFARVSVEGNIIFRGGQYVMIKNRIESGMVEVKARIKRGSKVMVEGMLKLYGNINQDERVAECGFRVVDAYTPVFQRWDEALPVSLIANRWISIEQTSGTKEFMITSTTVEHPEPANNWVWDHLVIVEIGVEVQHYYKKQVISFPAVGWDYDREIGGSTTWPTYKGKWSKAVLNPQTVTREVKHFALMYDWLEQFLLEVAPDVSIDSLTYSGYLNADTELKNLMIGNKSAIKNDEQTEKDKEIKLSTLLDFYKKLLNLDWKIVDGVFKLFHPSEISHLLPDFTLWPKHDLTDLNGRNWCTGMNTMTMNAEGIPYKEAWNAETSFDEDFDGKPVIYPVESEETIEHGLSDVNTNIVSVLKGDDHVSDSGYVMVTTDDSGYLIWKQGILSGESLPNGKMALTRLLDDHHRSDRYFQSGVMNGQQTGFTKPKPVRSLDKLSVPARLDDFNFDYLIKTDVGNMRLKSVTERLDGSFTELELEQ